MARGRRAVPAVATALVAALLVAGCGDSDESHPPEGGAGVDLGAPINLADCSDWKDASVDERLGTIREIRNFSGQEVAGSGGGVGVTLDDEKAYDLLDNYCENDFARAFKLYKLYGRAAGFGGG